jgi:hypothetical protein
MRAAHGKVLIKGIPRMTRPRARRNMDGVTGFSVVDPGGNWIRIVALGQASSPPPPGKLGRAVENAVVIADLHGDVGQALKILEGALARERAAASAADQAAAEAYLEELRERAS